MIFTEMIENILLKLISEEQKKIDELSAIEIENAFLPIERVVFLVNFEHFTYKETKEILILFRKLLSGDGKASKVQDPVHKKECMKFLNHKLFTLFI